MTGPEGERMVGVGGAQKHPEDLLHPGIHLLSSSGCSNPHLPPSLALPLSHPSRVPRQGLCEVEREASEAACPLPSCSAALWTVGAAVGPKPREKEETVNAACMMLRHERLRCEPNACMRNHYSRLGGCVGSLRGWGLCVYVINVCYMCFPP